MNLFTGEVDSWCDNHEQEVHTWFRVLRLEAVAIRYIAHYSINFLTLTYSPGDYYNRISDQITIRNQLVDEAHVQSTLFRCKDPDGDIIEYAEFCGENRCQDGGAKKSDHCWTPNSAFVISSSLSTYSSSTHASTFTTIPSTTSGSLYPTAPATFPTGVPARSMSHTSYITMAVGVGVGVTAFVVIVFALGFCYLKRRHARDVIETTDSRAPSMRTYSRTSERARLASGGKSAGGRSP